jgi:hypothetical protein
MTFEVGSFYLVEPRFAALVSQGPAKVPEDWFISKPSKEFEKEYLAFIISFETFSENNRSGYLINFLGASTGQVYCNFYYDNESFQVERAFKKLNLQSRQKYDTF